MSREDISNKYTEEEMKRILEAVDGLLTKICGADDKSKIFYAISERYMYRVEKVDLSEIPLYNHNALIDNFIENREKKNKQLKKDINLIVGNETAVGFMEFIGYLSALHDTKYITNETKLLCELEYARRYYPTKSK